MSARSSKLSRRGFLGGSILFVAGAAVGCSTDPTGGGSAGAKTTLNVWSHAYGEAGTQQALTRYATAFTKANPDIAVKVTWTPGDYSGKLNATLLTDAAPDVFEIGDFRESLARQGQIAQLDDIYGSAKSDFNPGARDMVTVDGKLYGVKTLDDVMMLYFRKSVLSKAGITPPDSFDALADAAKALSSKKTKGLFVGQDGLGDSAILSVFSNGGDLVTADGKAGFGSPRPPRPWPGSSAFTTTGPCCSASPPTGGIPPPSPRTSSRCSGAASGRCPPSRPRSATTSASCRGPPSSPAASLWCASAAGAPASTPRARTWTRPRSSSSGSGSSRPTSRRTGRRATASTSRRAPRSPPPPTSSPRGPPRRPSSWPPSTAGTTPAPGTLL